MQVKMFPDDPDKIKKQYYAIGEVSKALDVNTSTIRFWGTKFASINPKKNRKGNRMFTPEDFEILKRIHHLVKVKGYTIKGAQEALKSSGKQLNEEVQIRESLLKLRSFLEELKESL